MPTLLDHIVRTLPPEWTSGLEKFATSVRAFVAWFEEHGETVMAAIANAAVPLEELRGHQLARFVKVDRSDIGILIERGWYPDPRMAPIQIVMLSSWSDSDPDAVDEIMKNAYREGLESIEAKLVAEFPRRGPILRQAFDAHRDGKHFLSVPVLLTQADGIWRDRIDCNLFSGGIGNAIGTLAELAEDANSREFVHALNTPDWPLALSKKDRPDNFSDLNRHLVLHGEAMDYGTEENSLRAIAFLNYCAFVLSEADQPAGTSRTF